RETAVAGLISPWRRGCPYHRRRRASLGHRPMKHQYVFHRVEISLLDLQIARESPRPRFVYVPTRCALSCVEAHSTDGPPPPLQSTRAHFATSSVEFSRSPPPPSAACLHFVSLG